MLSKLLNHPYALGRNLAGKGYRDKTKLFGSEFKGWISPKVLLTVKNKQVSFKYSDPVETSQVLSFGQTNKLTRLFGYFEALIGKFRSLIDPFSVREETIKKIQKAFQEFASIKESDLQSNFSAELEDQQKLMVNPNADTLLASELTPCENLAIYEFAKNINYDFLVASKNGGEYKDRNAIEQTIVALNNSPTVVIGDLHASHQKLLETLFISNLVTMKPSKAEQLCLLLRRLDSLSMDSGLLLDPSQEDIAYPVSEVLETYQEIKELISDIEWIGNDRQLILLGDEIGDRGALDLVVMDIINHINDDRPNSRISVLASNHGLIALRDDDEFDYETSYSQRASFAVAKKLYGNEQLLKDEYLRFFANHKLMIYNPVSKTLYAHAMIEPQNIEDLIGQMSKYNYLPIGISKYSDVNESNIESFVDAANRFFYDYFSCEENLKELSDEESQEIYSVFEKDKDRRGRYKGFLWNDCPFEGSSQLPFYKRGVELFVHGHDTVSQSSPYQIDCIRRRASAAEDTSYRVVNLDQRVHKGPNRDNGGKINYIFVEGNQQIAA